MRHPDGPAPRFGSCYLILKPEATQRCTFTYLDSHQEPDERGTLDEFDDILAALFSEAFTRDYALGERDLTVPKLIRQLSRLDAEYPAPSSGDRRARNLNHYIEAQIHGSISLERDAEALIADPSFKGSRTGEALEAICAKCSIKLRWHAGYSLDPDQVPEDFRGPTMPSLARRVSAGQRLTAKMIGDAAASLRKDPSAWADRGSCAEVLQELKLLWHVLVTFGDPAAG